MNEGDIVRVLCAVRCYTRRGCYADKTFDRGALFKIHKLDTAFTGHPPQSHARLVSLDGIWISYTSLSVNFLTPLSPLEQLAEVAE